MQTEPNNDGPAHPLAKLLDFGKPDERNIMLDIETLGTTAGSVILTVGAAVFDNTGAVARYYRRISLNSSIALGCTVDADTLKWWQRQSESARAEAFDLVPSQASDTVGTALENIGRFFASGEKKVVLWGNGASFDPVLLAAYFGKFGLTLPFDYRNVRCYRTVSAMFPMVLRRVRQNAHNALADAEAQVQRLMDIRAFLRSTPTVSDIPATHTATGIQSALFRGTNLSFPFAGILDYILKGVPLEAIPRGYPKPSLHVAAESSTPRSAEHSNITFPPQ